MSPLLVELGETTVEIMLEQSGGARIEQNAWIGAQLATANIAGLVTDQWMHVHLDLAAGPSAVATVRLGVSDPTVLSLKNIPVDATTFAVHVGAPNFWRPQTGDLVRVDDVVLRAR